MPILEITNIYSFEGMAVYGMVAYAITERTGSSSRDSYSLRFIELLCLGNGSLLLEM